MPTVRETLSATATVVPLDAPTGRVVVTLVSGPAEVWATVDGSNPAQPTGTITDNGVVTIAGVLGAQGVLQPPLFGNHMQIPTLRLASAGTPVVEITW